MIAATMPRTLASSSDIPPHSLLARAYVARISNLTIATSRRDFDFAMTTPIIQMAFRRDHLPTLESYL